MQRSKYRKVSLQPLQPFPIKNFARNQPQFRAKTLSLGKSTKKIQIACPIQSNRAITALKIRQKQVSTLNLKQRKSSLSNKYSRKVQQKVFDKRVLCHQNSKSVRNTPQLRGLSRLDLNQRKQNHLNTYFNIRKNKLKEITKENKKIYDRINSQRSLYSSRQLNGSMESVSQSRISHKSSEHAIKSSRKNNSKKIINLIKRQTNVKIQSKDINKLQTSEVNRYLNIFCNQLNTSSKQNANKNLAKKDISIQREKENAEIISSGLQKILQQLQRKKDVKKKMAFGRLI